ncbi:hypothetical protein ABZ953_39065 [Streptomyces sp. NPDC046465]|uniref:hypothetical protein n=1 Tax=Streptomyces sp. NPDC046465 TaxID=3155810 RepID=UPI0033F5341A
MARDSVRRQAAGLTAQQVGEKVSEAARRAAETRAGVGVSAGAYGPDPEELAEQWAAKLVEWRRVQAVLCDSGAGLYEPGNDAEGSAWAQERAERRERALAGHAEVRRREQERREELRAQVWLSASVSRRLRAVAGQAGVSPELLLAQLAEHVESVGGAVSVPSFVPSPQV